MSQKDLKKVFYVANNEDNVATALVDVKAGSAHYVGESCDNLILVNEIIPFGFKVALHNIESGANIIKYGAVIGRATMTIKQGDKVHLHNCESLYDMRSSTLNPETAAPTDIEYI